MWLCESGLQIRWNNIELTRTAFWFSFQLRDSQSVANLVTHDQRDVDRIEKWSVNNFVEPFRYKVWCWMEAVIGLSAVFVKLPMSTVVLSCHLQSFTPDICRTVFCSPGIVSKKPSKSALSHKSSHSKSLWHTYCTSLHALLNSSVWTCFCGQYHELDNLLKVYKILPEVY